MSSVVAVKRHLFFAHHKKRLAEKVAQNVSSTPLSIIQASFCRAWIVLQYIEKKFFCGAVFVLRARAQVQPLGQRSTYNTTIADPGSPYVHTFQCLIFFRLQPFFYGWYLSSTSLPRLQTKTRRQSNSSVSTFLFYNPETPRSSVAAVKRHPFFTRHKKRLAGKVARIGSTTAIPMIILYRICQKEVFLLSRSCATRGELQ